MFTEPFFLVSIFFIFLLFVHFRSDCVCDDMFFDCLKKLNNTPAAQVMGSIYFNIVQVFVTILIQHNNSSINELFIGFHSQVPCIHETQTGVQFRKAREGFWYIFNEKEIFEREISQNYFWCPSMTYRNECSFVLIRKKWLYYTLVSSFNSLKCIVVSHFQNKVSTKWVFFVHTFL